ncbi:hypothetical protein NCAS_0H03580 [Naumovozyma castellii]|uniref:PAN2-PAN3 deadenylation complex subunit PAN3 n=1 Tax=Naumovozyma castellii TaxID=27288 RepID=G0VJI8_NAUCA|nr:hypothetical protein NCAS_0H03580 [Naumovozyma castellii CBS 4309]CCC71668.1 hypothetical protein NCAS_0H03580 [Naumovozyma castellii CBS 4309]
MDKINAEWAKDIPCRNVTIYGYCKKIKDGCPFKHSETDEPAAEIQEPVPVQQSPVAPVPSFSRKFNPKSSASFTPMSSKTPELAAVSSFERSSNPSSPAPPASIPKPMNSPLASQSSNASFPPQPFYSYPASSSNGTLLNNTILPDGISLHDPAFPLTQIDKTMLANDPNLPSANVPLQFSSSPASNIHQQMLNENNINNNNSRYPSIYPPPHSILQYHLYAPDPPPQLRLPLKPNERTPETLFIPNDLREQLVKKNLASLQIFPSGGAIPDIVQDYFGLVPLDFHQKEVTKDRYQGHKNSLYKVFSNLDGKVYILRRIHDVQIMDPQQIAKPFQKWNNLECNQIVKLRDLFLTTKFGDSSLCLVYDFYPQANSLYEHHFTNFPLVPITQDYLWTYLVQLTNAINVVHSKGFYIGLIDWDKIIVTGDPGRIKLSGCGAIDVLGANEELDLHSKQQMDFENLGQLLFKLASKIGNNANAKIDELSVDDQFKTVLQYLLNDTNDRKTINELSQLFIDKILSNVESSQGYAEYTEGILSRELENGRLFRLICKLNFIFGKIESRVDINWSESGEKFPIILFYDFVFHQVDETGKSVMDLTHVLRCLNKLDAGAPEKLILATPDEMNCIIISYKELKDLIDTTFRSMTQ